MITSTIIKFFFFTKKQFQKAQFNISENKDYTIFL